MIRRLSFFCLLTTVIFCACSDDDSFGTGSGNVLSFSTDTLRFDTLFSTVPSATQTFWIHNRSADGIRISRISLGQGGDSPFRVNVDGTYVDGYPSEWEIRKGDSLLVFVEATLPVTHQMEPLMVRDELHFQLESGVEQRMPLSAWAWDAVKVNDLVVTRDTTIQSAAPLLVEGAGILVAAGATLVLRDTELYFHAGAGIHVEGTLQAEGCLLRGDRLDHMFSYLPYDRISGQWRGIDFTSSSMNNSLADCVVRNAEEAIVCAEDAMLSLRRVHVHNSSATGVSVVAATLTAVDCVFSNAGGDCLAVDGGAVTLDGCTLAQFYPFIAERGAALRFSHSAAPLRLVCNRLLATGYEADVVMGEWASDAADSDFLFSDCLLRTPTAVEETHFQNVTFETAADEFQGKDHFLLIDEDALAYDFGLQDGSPAFVSGIGCREMPRCGH